MIGDSLVFDFGETQAVQDHFRQIGGVKVRLDECARTHGCGEMCWL